MWCLSWHHLSFSWCNPFLLWSLLPCEMILKRKKWFSYDKIILSHTRTISLQRLGTTINCTNTDIPVSLAKLLFLINFIVKDWQQYSLSKNTYQVLLWVLLVMVLLVLLEDSLSQTKIQKKKGKSISDNADYSIYTRVWRRLWKYLALMESDCKVRLILA